MQGRIKGIEDRLGQLQLGREQEVAGDDDQGAPSEEEADTSEEEALIYFYCHCCFLTFAISFDLMLVFSFYGQTLSKCNDIDVYF